MSGGPADVAGAVAAHRPRLVADARAFAAAVMAFFAGARDADAPPDAFSRRTRAAVTRWRGDVTDARSAVAAVEGGAPERSLALAALDALDGALAAVARAVSATDPSVAVSASSRALSAYDDYEELAARLDRRLG